MSMNMHAQRHDLNPPTNIRIAHRLLDLILLHQVDVGQGLGVFLLVKPSSSRQERGRPMDPED
jgi:hypothetical protein